MKHFQRFSLFILFFTALLLFTSTAAEASYYTQYYGQTLPTSRLSQQGSFVSFPVYPGSYQEQEYRNSNNLNQLNELTSNTQASSTLSEFFNSRNIGASVNVNQNLQDINAFAQQSQRTQGFENGNMQYSLGDGNELTSYRRLSGNFKGKRNDFDIIEEIRGGPQVQLNKNYGNSYSTLNNAGFNQRQFTNNFGANAAFQDQTQQGSATNSNSVQQTQNQRYSLQQSSFGNGMSIIFNR